MKKYIIDISDYDGNIYYEFEHSTKTDEEFRADVNSLLVKYAEEYFASTTRTFPSGMVVEKSITDVDWIRFITPKLYEMGYFEPQPYESYYSFSQIGPFNKSKKKYMKEEYKEFEKIVGKALVDRAIKINIEKGKDR